MAQVAGAAVIFEVQRSSRSEARKEEKRRQEIEMVEKGWDMVDIGVEYLVGSLHRTADLLCFKETKAKNYREHKQGNESPETWALKQKLDEVEQLARGRGLGGFSHFKHGHATEEPRQWSRTEYFVQRLQLTRAARHQVLMKFPILKSTESYTSGSRPHLWVKINYICFVFMLDRLHIQFLL
ncbi:hypothetical protein NC652_004143 [Populus alba x Populus x berolinensis]|nr:hypothetical protein NC652_004143 [Populus alba x Populus x berolinensis]